MWFSPYLLSQSNIHVNLCSKAVGTKVYSISKDNLASLKIKIPSLDEQAAIASALSDIDSLISSIEQLIAKKNLIKHGAMHELLTGKKRLPGFEGGWHYTNATQIGTFRSGNVFPEKYQGNAPNSDTFPFFKVSDLNNDNIFLKNSRNYITKEDAKDIHASLIPKNSIIFAKIGAAIFLERKRILKQNSFIDNNMCAFICRDKIDYSFIYYKFLEFKFGTLVNTTALPALNSNDLNNINFYIPQNVSEQTAIASVLSDMDNEIAALEVKLEKTRKIRSGMMEELLTGRIRLV